MQRTILSADRVVTGEADLTSAAVVIEGEHIVDVLPRADVANAIHLKGWLIPGFVDVHVHGGGGGSFDDPVGAKRAIAYHRAHGSTSITASLVSATLADLEIFLPALRELVDAGELLGIHLEGPFLSPTRAGAQRRDVLIHPTSDNVERLRLLAEGIPSIVTIAPELPGAAEAICILADSGWTVALGHSDASFEDALAGINAGAQLITHLFNGMRPLHHREPGIAELALLDPRVVVELILDGHHLSNPAVAIATSLAEGRWIAVTDSIAASGMGDGTDHLGGQEVEIAGGVARLTGTPTLAGSTLTMDSAFDQLLTVHGKSVLESVRGTSTRPAEVLGRVDIGRIASGAVADLVHWQPNVGVQAVMRHGAWI